MRKVKLFIAGLLVAMFGYSFQQASAAVYYESSKENGTITIKSGKTVDSSAFLTGGRIVVDGTVDGDLYCAGNNIEVNGTIKGDVICAGSAVKVGGTVEGNIRAAGNIIEVNGNVGGNVTSAGNTVMISEQAQVAGDLIGGASSVDINGKIGRDVLTGAGDMTIAGTVGRDVETDIQSLTFGDNAKINRNFIYKSSQEQSIPQGVVAGETSFQRIDSTRESADITNIITFVLILLTGFVLLAVFVTLIMPKYVHGAAVVSNRTLLLAFLVGFATLALTPAVAVMLLFSIVGIPIAIVLMIVWLLLMVLSGVFAAYRLGYAVLGKRATNALLVALVGAVILSILCLMPIVQVIVIPLAIFIGVGLQILHIQHQFSKKPYAIVAK